MNDDLSLIVCGDLHLGRHPSGIDSRHDKIDFSPRKIWQKIVMEACGEELDAVVITGDLVDRENSFYEAWGPFEEGLRKLNQRAIPVIVVAGNHDAQLLEGFVDSLSLENLHLLGKNGCWERFPLEREGKVIAYFDGWSYPFREVRENPLDDYDFPLAEPPVFAVLHTELDKAGSSYAPVYSSQLKQTNCCAWFLGHIHKPQLHNQTPLILNPGSPQPLNPTEVGLHGPWRVDLKNSGRIDCKQLSLSNLRYISVEIDAGQLKSLQSVPELLKNRIAKKLERPLTGLELLSCRVKFTGRTEFYQDLKNQLKNILSSLELKIETLPVNIEKIIDQTLPPVDLEKLKDKSGPVGILAEFILQLDDPQFSVPEQLLEKILLIMNDSYETSTYRVLQEIENSPPVPVTADLVREKLKQQGLELLETLRQQKEID